MKRFIIFFLLCLCAYTGWAQGIVKGKILDRQKSEPLGFVNIKVTEQGSDKFVGGGITDAGGNFNVSGLKDGKYTLTLTFMGYKDVTRQFEITPTKRDVQFKLLYMAEDAKQLNEVTVTGQRATMKLEVDRKSFDVGQLISNAGQSASDVLDNVPSIEVDNDGNVSLRGNSSVEVWINGKASGLTSDNRAQILQQLPAESIDRVEVIDNPSAKFSAEGSAGIINIVLKKDRKAGYYGSVQAGGDTRGGANTSFNVNYNSRLIDSYLNIGYRHRANTGHMESQQTSDTYNQTYDSDSKQRGNNFFTRAGVTLHATTKDDFSLSGMLMHGGGNSHSYTPYIYTAVANGLNNYQLDRINRSRTGMDMRYGEFNYRHSFNDKHFIDFTADLSSWKMNGDNWYQDSTVVVGIDDVTYSYQYRPQYINNHRKELKLEYENQVTKNFKIEAGYNGNFSRENTPQESYMDNTSFDGTNASEDKLFFNRFIYKQDLHAFYTTLSYKFGALSLMGGLRGEYWRVNTESYTWEQEHDASLREQPFKKDYFQLFPSVFMSWQMTETQQLQLNYTRRLRRPWGGQLNSFRDTRDATTVSFGNPYLTPEFSNSFSLNYLKQWNDHSLLVSAYYRPTTDVIQRISYKNQEDGLFYQTSMNVAKSVSTGLEMTVKNKLWRILDLTTSANAYYYRLNGFSYDIDGQTVTGNSDHNFTWNARMTASLMLPYDISIQTTGRYTARQVITQGYRKANYSIDFGARKNFFNKMFTLSVNCRDLLDSRRFETFTSGPNFTRHQINRRGGRRVSMTLTWNFGNMKQKKRPNKNQGSENDMPMDYNGGEE
ncbi:TonB-dependent receptor [Prevotella stercorea]|uniref:TonB-dependent receptor domain-containing protein n=1 Tax=Leyella stercorea TaxID=363265 RepID=UPI001F45F6EF|nr:TonB-dependent receptor [Leyella stercorea]MCF2645493.1 TonB-dependent receptor [Leyella stercorea]MCF2645513.1 TonB-dependent receptor [Leyella stercorea]